MQRYSFKELDEHFRQTKGWAFKVFKQRSLELAEGSDFIYLSATDNAAEINELKAQKKVYANSVNVVLITDNGLAKLGIEIVGH